MTEDEREEYKLTRIAIIGLLILAAILFLSVIFAPCAKAESCILTFTTTEQLKAKVDSVLRRPDIDTVWFENSKGDSSWMEVQYHFRCYVGLEISPIAVGENEPETTITYTGTYASYGMPEISHYDTLITKPKTYEATLRWEWRER